MTNEFAFLVRNAVSFANNDEVGAPSRALGLLACTESAVRFVSARPYSKSTARTKPARKPGSH